MTSDPRLRTLVSPGAEQLTNSETVSRESSVSVQASPTTERNAALAEPPVTLPRASFEATDSLAEHEKFEPGELIAGRFQIEKLAQVGGMGAIYRALDLHTHEPVAIKTLRSGRASLKRFEREAERLARLRHPGIPTFLQSGWTSRGQAYFAMEWLEGLDLASYLEDRRLGLHAAIDLVIRVAEAVSLAHDHHIVHRDLNPGNIFLVGGSPEEVRILDFGISHLVSEDQPRLTEPGGRLGTPGYMAPEQVEGAEISTETDVFALGCILYELITGKRPFSAPTIAELFAQVLRQRPEPPSQLNAAVPPELDEVVLSCLEKERSLRPQRAHELVQLLRSIQLHYAPPAEEEDYSQSTPLASGEQHISSVLVLRDDLEGTYERTKQVALAHGLNLHRNKEGILILATTGVGTASDHATRAARCALALQKATRARDISISTGLTLAGSSVPSGRALDSAHVSLQLSHRRGDSGSVPRGSTVWMDENTATLLDSRFNVRAAEHGFVLLVVRESYEPTRTVLGRKTRCVGRKRELSMLEATLHECVEESMASAVLVTGAPGIGKSRLVYELTRRIRRLETPIEIFRGNADSMSAGAPFAILIQVILRACQIRENEPENLRREKLLARLTRTVPEAELPRVAEFLGELIGMSVYEKASPQLTAARRDAVLRGDQLLRAFEDWLRAECTKQPVLLILDDFHWGDLPTVKFIDSALRNLSELPLFVIASARPEIHQLFPQLWAHRGVTEVRLSGLSRRATSEMVREVLGQSAEEHIVQRITTQSQGNPFWIEELLRAADAGLGDSVPDRVLLLAQSRIEILRSDARRLLLLASVFGRKLNLQAIQALLPTDVPHTPSEALLRELIDGEFLLERHQAGQQYYEFASGLLRDAAYSLLAEEEKERLHSEAARWLEQNEETSALPIALHYTLGGQPERARIHYLHAAQQSLSGNDLDGALSSVVEGLATGATGEIALQFRLVQAEACRWRGDNAAALRAAEQAWTLCKHSIGPHFFRTISEAAVAAGKIGEVEACKNWGERLLLVTDESLEETEFTIALCRVATQLILLGHTELAQQLLEKAEQQQPHQLHPDPNVLGYLHEARAVLAGALENPIDRMDYADRAAEYFEDAGDLRNACLQRISLGFAQVEFGANHEAITSLREALQIAERMDLTNSIPLAQAHLGRALARLGELEEAEFLLEEAAARLDRQKNRRLAGMCRLYLAEYHVLTGALELALDSAQHAVSLLTPFPAMQRVAQAILALLQLEHGELDTAWTNAQAARGEAQQEVNLPVGGTWVRLAWIELIRAREGAEAAIPLLKQEMERWQLLTENMSPVRAQHYREGTLDRKRLTELSQNPHTTISWGSSSSYQKSSPSTASSCLTDTQAEIQRIIQEEDPVLRNLLITHRYYILSSSIARLVTRSGLNWSTFACWASKTAGLSIRNEEIPRFFQRQLKLDQESLGTLQGAIGRWFEKWGWGELVRNSVVGTLREVSQQVAEGNLKVFQELAPLFAEYIDLLQSEASDAQLEEFYDSLRPGTSESGGQEPLRLAFRSWTQASRTTDPQARAEHMLYGNCLIGLHEQTRLQPHIADALSAPIRLLFRQELQKRLPRLLGVPLAFLISLLFQRMLHSVQELWLKIATRYVMNLSLPGDQQLPLGRDIPHHPAVFPPTLRQLRMPELIQLLKQFDQNLDSTVGSRATNWAELPDRMGFIVELFRSRQEDLSLFSAPFTPSVEEKILQGELPQEAIL